MKRASPRRDTWSRRRAVIRRELARRDRELFGPRGSGRRVSRNDQYFHLWQRILVQLAEALGKWTHNADFGRLEELAGELERAQRQEQLPRGLIRKILPRSRHGSIRKEQA